MSTASWGIIKAYRRVFGRRAFYRLNRAMYFLSLHGIGIGNWETPELSGEKFFINRFVRHVKTPTVIDVGANVGKYSEMIKSLAPEATIYAFEPHPQTYKRLKESADRLGYTAVNAACSAEIGTAALYDHGDGQSETGTEHASLIKDVIESVHKDTSRAWNIEVTTVDRFLDDNAVEHIDLLKIDVEGGEMNVLLGAANSLNKQMIDTIHFEFTEANTVSRTFMKDFYSMLPNFDFYRMLPDGLVQMGPYYSLTSEIFAYQNIVAVRKGCGEWV